MILFLRHVMRRTLQNLKGNLWLNLTTVGMVMVSVLIFATFSLIAFNLGSFLSLWEDRIEIIVYLKKQASLKDVEGLLKQARTIGGVSSVKYVSPYDAMLFMEKKLGGQKNLLGGIKPAVFPASFEIELTKEYRNAAGIKEVASRLNGLPQIEEIQYGQEWVETFSSLVHILRLTQWILGGVLLIAMTFIISNTLQLTMVSRREETVMMRMVGASPALVQVPFYVEGLIQGLLGAGLAMLLLFSLHRVFLIQASPFLQQWLSRIPILFLPAGAIVRILLGGAVLGLLGSFMAVTRFLKQG